MKSCKPLVKALRLAAAILAMAGRVLLACMG